MPNELTSKLKPLLAQPLVKMLLLGLLPCAFISVSILPSGLGAIGLCLAGVLGFFLWFAFRSPPKGFWLPVLLLSPLLGFACLGFGSMEYFSNLAITAQFEKALSPSNLHWFGTDYEGRDILATLVIGGKNAYMVAFFSCITALAVGTLTGTFLTLKNKVIRSLSLGVIQFFEIVPQLFFVLIVMGVYNFWVAQRATNQPSTIDGILIAGLAIGLSSVPSIARVVENRLLQLKSQRFVTALEASNVSVFEITGYNLLWKNCTAELAVQSTFLFGAALLLESALSFAFEIGFGDLGSGGYLSWGKLLAEARRSILFGEQSWIVLAPTLATLSSILGINILGDQIAKNIQRGR